MNVVLLKKIIKEELEKVLKENTLKIKDYSNDRGTGQYVEQEGDAAEYSRNSGSYYGRDIKTVRDFSESIKKIFGILSQTRNDGTARNKFAVDAVEGLEKLDVDQFIEGLRTNKLLDRFLNRGGNLEKAKEDIESARSEAVEKAKENKNQSDLTYDPGRGGLSGFFSKKGWQNTDRGGGYGTTPPSGDRGPVRRDDRYGGY